MAATDKQLNIEVFHVAHLISDYSNTLFDIDLFPDNKHIELSKFLNEVRVHLFMELLEVIRTKNKIKVYLSIDVKCHVDHFDKKGIVSLYTKGRNINGEECIDDVLDSLIEDILGVRQYNDEYYFRLFPIERVLSANLHIVADDDNFNILQSKYRLISKLSRFGHKFRYASPGSLAGI